MGSRIVAPYVAPKAVALTGTGPPSGTPAGGVGSLYTDTTMNWVYLYQSYGWQLLNPHLKYRANTLYSGQDTTNINNSNAMGNNILRVLPKKIEARLPAVALQLTVAAGGASETGGTCRMGIYADSGDGKTPGSLLVEAPTVAVDVVGERESTAFTVLILEPGLYWVGGVMQNCSTTRPNCNVAGTLLSDLGYGAGGLAATGVSGSLPSTFPSFTIGSASPPLVRIRTQT